MFFFFTCGNLKSTKDAVHISIMGNWLLTNIQGVSCNSCPEITFFENGSGRITKPSKEEILFKYILSSENKILFTISKDENYFKNKDYKYTLYSENNLEILKLNSMKSNLEYILTRYKDNAPD